MICAKPLELAGQHIASEGLKAQLGPKQQGKGLPQLDYSNPLSRCLLITQESALLERSLTIYLTQSIANMAKVN